MKPYLRGKSLIFFRTPPSKSQKNHIQKSQNHKKITYRKHQKSQITENVLKNDTTKSLKCTKIAKKSQKKSCDFKITKITYAILRSDLPLGHIYNIQDLFTIILCLKFAIKTKENSFYIVSLKLYREVPCFDSADRLFQSFCTSIRETSLAIC